MTPKHGGPELAERAVERDRVQDQAGARRAALGGSVADHARPKQPVVEGAAGRIERHRQQAQRRHKMPRPPTSARARARKIARRTARRAHDAQAGHQLARRLAGGAGEVAGVEEREEAEVESEPRPARSERRKVHTGGAPREIHERAPRARRRAGRRRPRPARARTRAPAARPAAAPLLEAASSSSGSEVGLAQQHVVVERGHRAARDSRQSAARRGRGAAGPANPPRWLNGRSPSSASLSRGSRRAPARALAASGSGATGCCGRVAPARSGSRPGAGGPRRRAPAPGPRASAAPRAGRTAAARRGPLLSARAHAFLHLVAPGLLALAQARGCRGGARPAGPSRGRHEVRVGRERALDPRCRARRRRPGSDRFPGSSSPPQDGQVIGLPSRGRAQGRRPAASSVASQRSRRARHPEHEDDHPQGNQRATRSHGPAGRARAPRFSCLVRIPLLFHRPASSHYPGSARAGSSLKRVVWRSRRAGSSP